MALRPTNDRIGSRRLRRISEALERERLGHMQLVGGNRMRV